MTPADSYSEFEQALYSVIDLTVGPQDASLIVMDHGVGFLIKMNTNNLHSMENDGSFLLEFLRLKDAVEDEFEAMETLCDYMISPCFLYLQKLSPASTPRFITLQNYFDPRTYVFSLVNVQGQIDAKASSHTEEEIRRLTPRVSHTEPAISAALAQGVPTIVASKLQISRAEDAREDELNDLPRAVVLAGSNEGQKLAFKTVSDKASFRREVECLLKLRAQNNSQDLLMSRIAGLVVLEDEHDVLGFVFDYVDHKDTLDSVLDQASELDRKKWANQIQHSLKELHSMDVVWGNIKPDNVLIDSVRNAVIIDFGGGSSPTWVDVRLEGTKEEYLQGVEPLVKFMGLN